MKNFKTAKEFQVNLKPVVDKVDYAQQRWEDEREYEDRNDYIKVLKEVCTMQGFEYKSASETFKSLIVKGLLDGNEVTVRIKLTANSIKVEQIA